MITIHLIADCHWPLDPDEYANGLAILDAHVNLMDEALSDARKRPYDPRNKIQPLWVAQLESMASQARVRRILWMALRPHDWMN